MKALNANTRKVRMTIGTKKKKSLFSKNQAGVVDYINQMYPELANVIFYDTFAHKVIIKGKAPWDKVVPEKGYRNWATSDLLNLTNIMQNMGIDISKDSVHDGVHYIAMRKQINPLVDLLDSLVDDGRNLLDDWLITYAGAKGNTTYLRSIGPKFLISAVARAYKPGCKVDTMLVLEGDQGKRKSELVKVLALQPDWFTDNVEDISNKDTYEIIRGKWFVEIPELDAFRHARQTKLKAFVSRQHDNFRPLYEKYAIALPRCCVFVGTTNEHEYSKDETGNRRNWPVACEGQIKIDELRRDIYQLLAEAVRRFKDGEAWWFTTDEEIKLAEYEQQARLERDPWEDRLIAAIEQRLNEGSPIVSIEELLVRNDNELYGFNFELVGVSKAERNRVKACITGTQKYKYTRLRVDGKRVCGFIRKLSNDIES
jgi:putative DNA primase/helicase